MGLKDETVAEQKSWFNVPFAAVVINTGRYEGHRLKLYGNSFAAMPAGDATMTVGPRTSSMHL
jgi:hypothetical protein